MTHLSKNVLEALKQGHVVYHFDANEAVKLYPYHGMVLSEPLAVETNRTAESFQDPVTL